MRINVHPLCTLLGQHDHSARIANAAAGGAQAVPRHGGGGAAGSGRWARQNKLTGSLITIMLHMYLSAC